MGDRPQVVPKRFVLARGELESAGQRGPGGKEEEWMDCVAEDYRRVFGITGDWSTTGLDPGAW